MGLPEDEKIAELLAEYTTGNVVKITTILKDLLSSGVKPETLAEEMISTIIAKPKVELFDLLAKLPDVKAPFAEAKLLVALVNSGRVLAESIFSRDEAIHNSSKTTSEGVLSAVSRSGARLAGPSPRAAGATPRFANLRTPLRQDTAATPQTIF